MYQVGRVLVFKADRSKRFGFLRTEDDAKVFFHYSGGRSVELVNGQVHFGHNNVVNNNGWAGPLKDPEPEDLLICEIVRGPKGFKALQWSYLQHLDALDPELPFSRQTPEPLRHMTTQTRYRIIQSMNWVGDPPGVKEVLWEGQDLDEVRRLYPLPSDNLGTSKDPLQPYWTDSRNNFEVKRWWEVQHPDGSWDRCCDPRPLAQIFQLALTAI